MLASQRPATVGSGSPDERDFAVRDAWRQLAEESTYALRMLPSRFTIPEMQSVYEAIWALEDLPNFHRWVSRNEGMVTEVPAEKLEGAAAQGLKLLQQNPVGLGVGALVGASPVAAMLTIGSTRAYRNFIVRERANDTAERGKPPAYYQRGDREPRLDAVFPPRPVWDWSRRDLIIRALGGPKNVLSVSFEGAGPWGVRLRDAGKAHSDRLRQLGLVLDVARQQVVPVTD